MTFSLKERYQFIQRLIREAGDTALSFYASRHNLYINTKRGDKQDEVSIADVQVEQQIRNAIETTFPEDGFLGEESGYTGLDKQFCWVVDPIDGTSAFLHGLHSWCISIALFEQGEIVAGCVLDPVHNELFHACKGQGAYLNSQPICTLQQAENWDDGLIGMGVPRKGLATPESIMPMFQKILNEGGVYVRNGSAALTLAHVAAGRLMAYYEPYLRAWDSFAGAILVKEAGGVINNPLGEHWKTQGQYVLAAANPQIFNKLYDTYRSFSQ